MVGRDGEGPAVSLSTTRPSLKIFAKERFVRFGRFQALLFAGEPSETFCAEIVASEEVDCAAVMEACVKKKTLKLVDGGSVVVRCVAGE